jgi:hypothetical protein
VAAHLLQTLTRLGVTVKLVRGNCVRLDPASRVPAELVSLVRESKPEILAALRQTQEALPEPKPVPSWPPESLDADHRFGVPCARLCPYLGRKVRTPEGLGTLLQVFGPVHEPPLFKGGTPVDLPARCTVLLDAARDTACRFFAPEDIEPVSPELP